MTVEVGDELHKVEKIKLYNVFHDTQTHKNVFTII